MRPRGLDPLGSTFYTTFCTRRYFVARGDVGRARDRPHFVYGDYQRRRKLAPEALARFADEAWAKSLDPLNGELEKIVRWL